MRAGLARLIVPVVCVYERATLESGLILEDPRLGAIDRQLDARVCRVVCACARTRAHAGARGSDGATCTYLWKAAGIRMPDGRRVIISHATARCHRKIPTSGRPVFWRRAKTTILGPVVVLRHCAIARQVSLDTIHILRRFTRSNLFVSLLFPRGAYAFLRLPPPSSARDATFLPPAACSPSWRCSSQLTYRPVVQLLLLFLAKRRCIKTYFLLSTATPMKSPSHIFILVSLQLRKCI